MNFSIKDSFSKFDQIRRKLRIWPHLLKKSLIENSIFRAVLNLVYGVTECYHELLLNFRNTEGIIFCRRNHLKLCLLFVFHIRLK